MNMIIIFDYNIAKWWENYILIRLLISFISSYLKKKDIQYQNMKI